MDIQPATQHSRYTVVASHYARLNSNVIDGGGDDDTAVLQAILDMAPVWGSLYLILGRRHLGFRPAGTFQYHHRMPQSKLRFLS